MAAQVSKDQLRDYILDVVKDKKPETTPDLLQLVKEKYSLPDGELLAILVELEEEDKIHFTKKEPQQPQTLGAYLFSASSFWYWLSIIIAIATSAAVFMIPEEAYPLTYVRQILGVVFVLFLPGFVFIKALYPSKLPIATSSENLDTVERIALSIGLSIALVAITGLILNYTPWGIRLTPITLSLFALTIVFATVSLLRSYYGTTELEVLK